MVNKNIKILVAVIVIVAVVSGIAFTKGLFSNKSSNVEKKYDILKLPTFVNGDAFIAEEKGFFEAENIKIQWTGKQVGAGPGNVVSVVAGQNDAGGSISTAMIKSIAEGSKLKIVAGMGTVSTKENPSVVYIVPENSSIKGVASDFIGKKVVANPLQYTWYPLVVYLKRNGVDYNKVEFVNLPSPITQEQVIKEGQVDVLAADPSNPPGSKLLQEKGFRVLPGISFWETLGITQSGTWVMRTDFVEKNPELVKRFVSALQNSNTWAKDHPDEAQEILNRRTEVPEQYWKYNIPRPRLDSILVDGNDIKKWIDLLVEFGQLKEGQVKAEDIYTNEFNPLYQKSKVN
jgi:ABC-type nitrate/sulfonate/bicarbonate transport system substrate-binding protein